MLRTAGLSLENRVHSLRRCRAVCSFLSEQSQVGEGAIFILKRYSLNLPWLVRNWVRMKFGQRDMESLCGMSGMRTLVCLAVAELM